ncbi:hypothetical protein B0H34DRAFT_645682 [Crassisporium funariophilum]|nr:hypothetical protein B0H34DRAFT_645682 [Crassisporium funariophilum]
MPSTALRQSKPTSWPQHLPYIDSPHYHSSVSPALRKHLLGSPIASNLKPPDQKPPKIVIRRISSPSHPAYGQFGLFAAQRIPPKTHIIDYIGEIHCDDRPDSDYDLSLCRLEDGVCVGVDASIMGNQARFVNDYRRVATKANAVFMDGRLPSGELRLSIWSCPVEIRKGEEILVSYGKSWWRSRSGKSGPTAAPHSNYGLD